MKFLKEGFDVFVLESFENCIKCAFFFFLKVKHVLKHVNFNIHVSDFMNIGMCITQLPL